MTYYTVPTANDTKGFFEIFKYIGVTASGGLFWPVILLVIWVVTFIALKSYSTSRAWTFASFFCSVLGILLAVMDYMAPTWMYLCIFLTAIGAVWLKLEDA